jgi:predicted methyltransferase
LFSGSVEKALLEFFSSTTVSAAIADALAEAQKPMTSGQILTAVREIRHMEEIPLKAIESSLIILSDAEIIAHSKDGYLLTDLGKELVEKLKTYRGG